MTKAWRRAIAALGGITVVLGATAFLHTPHGRALLGASACPWSGKAPSADKIEESRVKNSALLRGAAPSAAQPAAYGFQIARSTRADVVAWGAKEHAQCADELGGAAMRCVFDDAKPGEPSDVFYRFDPRGTIVGVDVMHEGTTVAEAASRVDTLADVVAKAAGPATTMRGLPARTHLNADYLSQSVAEFRFTDYAADISATNHGARGVVVREQYRAVGSAPIKLPIKLGMN